MDSTFSTRTRHAMRTGLFDQRTNMIDARPLLLVCLDYIPIAISFIFLGVGVLAIIAPSISNFLFLLGAPLFFYGLSVQMDYLISAPYAKDKKKHKFKRNQSSEKAQSGLRIKKGDAWMLVGYDLLFNRQLWIDVDRETRMSLIAGTTGSGKTVALCAQLFQASLQGHIRGGAPIIVVDGKGSVEGLYEFIFYIVRTGRIHDLRILNFLTGGAAQDISRMLDEQYTSNKSNPFSMLNADECRGLTMSFGKSSEGGSNDYFRGRASELLSGLFPILTYLRDNHGERLDITVIQQALGLRELIRLASMPDLPPSVSKPLREYLKTLNMIDDAYFTSDSSDVELNQKAEEQHTYNKSMVSKTVNEMAGTLGHIFSSVGSDLNPRNVILHGQIMLTLLPTIEKEPDALSELGRMVVGSLRPAFASLFGWQIQGSKKKIIDGLPTQRIVPIRVYYDEVVNYYTKGMSQFLSLLRSLGVAISLLAQSMKGFEDQGVSEARQSVANLNNKYIYGTQDVYDTLDLLIKSLGKMRVRRLAEMTRSVWGGWQGGDRLQDSEESIVDERDMAGADPNEGLYLYRGKPIPFRSATMFPDEERDGTLDHFYLNHFAELEFPTEEQVTHIKSVMGFELSPNDPDTPDMDTKPSPNLVLSRFVDHVNAVMTRIEQREKTDLYSSFDVLCFALVEDLVSVDLEEAKQGKQTLKQEGEAQFARDVENRSTEHQMDLNEESCLVVDAYDQFESHNDLYTHQLGLDVDYDLPNFGEDEVGDIGATGDPSAAPLEDNGESDVFLQNTAEEASWIDHDALKATTAHLPSFGTLLDDSESDGVADVPSENNEQDDDAPQTFSSPLLTHETKELVSMAASCTNLDKAFIEQELLNVKIYPTTPTPSEISLVDQASLTAAVKEHMDEAETRFHEVIEERNNSLVNAFLDTDEEEE